MISPPRGSTCEQNRSCRSRGCLRTGQLNREVALDVRAETGQTQEAHVGSGAFTEDEKATARKSFGIVKECPACGKSGNIDDLFGWRRMKPEDRDIAPQSQCKDCRVLFR